MDVVELRRTRFRLGLMSIITGVLLIFALVSIPQPVQAVNCVRPIDWGKTRVGQSMTSIEYRLKSTGRLMGTGRSGGKTWRLKWYGPLCGAPNVRGEVRYWGQMYVRNGRLVFVGWAKTVRTFRIVTG